MFSFAILAIALPLFLLTLALTIFLVYVWIRYSPIIGRIFEETPVFQPLRMPLERGGEDVCFRTPDGLELDGTYYPARTAQRAGVIVFCQEYLGDRGSFQPYCEGLREAGFDLFAFDFRNHGTSQTDPNYKPLQWVSDLEILDLRAALAYLRSRPDHDPAGVGLLGVSRGGGTALCVAAREPSVWGVVTDGAFPTRGTVFSYVLRWAEIYVGSQAIWERMPLWMFAFAGWAGRVRYQRRIGRRYPNVERAVSRIAPRPWLMIHGEKDAYIIPEIARGLFKYAGNPKELWIVPRAKHNRCRDVDPATYRARVVDFFRRYAPREVETLPYSDPEARSSEDSGIGPTEFTEKQVTSSISG